MQEMMGTSREGQCGLLTLGGHVGGWIKLGSVSSCRGVSFPPVRCLPVRAKGRALPGLRTAVLATTYNLVPIHPTEQLQPTIITSSILNADVKHATVVRVKQE